MTVKSKKNTPNLAECGQNRSIIVGEKQGDPVYSSNPSIPEKDSIARKKRVRLGDDKKGIIIDNNSGEMLTVGGVGFYEYEEVDETRFVKLFLAGIKQATGLSRPGLLLFEVIYRELQKKPGKDTVGLSLYLVSEYIEEVKDRTYRRGLAELLSKKFIFRSPIDGIFYVNIQYMFNGDRLAFIKGYKRSKLK